MDEWKHHQVRFRHSGRIFELIKDDFSVVKRLLVDDLVFGHARRSFRGGNSLTIRNMIVIRKIKSATKVTILNNLLIILGKSGAANRTRTCDPVITNDVLYQLSYCGGPNAAPGKPGTPAPDIGHGPDWQEKRGLFWF